MEGWGGVVRGTAWGLLGRPALLPCSVLACPARHREVCVFFLIPAPPPKKRARAYALELHGAEAEEEVEHDTEESKDGGEDAADAHAPEEVAEGGLLLVGEEALPGAPVRVGGWWVGWGGVVSLFSRVGVYNGCEI